MRKSLALILSAGLLATLSACAPSAQAPASINGCNPLAASGASSSLVTATGELASPSTTISFGTPLLAPAPQRSVLIQGSGMAAEVNDIVLGTAVVAEGATGKIVQQGNFMLTLNQGKTSPGLLAGLVCAQKGDRIALASPTSALSTTAADPTAAPQTGVILFDITNVLPGRAIGGDQPAQAGFPSVVTTSIGQPGLTIPSGTVPTELSYTALKKGNGPTVASGDALTVQSLGVVYASKSVFESTWTDGAAKQLLVADETTTKGGVVPGLAAALVGQTVGSQIIAVIPPEQGFGAQGNGSTVPAGATLVYVIDILGITNPTPAK